MADSNQHAPHYRGDNQGGNRGGQRRGGGGGRGRGRGRGRGGRGGRSRGYGGGGGYRYTRFTAKPVFQSQETDVFVKQLPTDLDQTELENKLKEQFAKFGEITATRISNSFNRFFYSVSYKSPESAKKAIEALNGMKINGQEIKVEIRRSKVPLQNQVYVGGLSEAITDEAVEKVFAVHGPVLNFDRSRNKNFAIITFENKDAATAAIEKSNATQLEGATLNVHQNNRGGGGRRGGRGRRGRGGPARPRNQDPKRIFVGGLPENCNPDEVKSTFGADAIDFKGRHAFLTFSSVEAAQGALGKIDVELQGKKLRVENARS